MNENSTLNEIIAELVLAYPKALNDLGARGKDYVRLLASRLSDIPSDVLAPAVDELINTAKWFPTIAEIRERCAERALALPSETEALSQIERHMACMRYDPPEERPFVHPLVRVALSHVGGFSAMRDTREPAMLRGQFGRLYREERASMIRLYQAGSMTLDPGDPPPGLLGAHRAVS